MSALAVDPQRPAVRRGGRAGLELQAVVGRQRGADGLGVRA